MNPCDVSRCPAAGTVDIIHPGQSTVYRYCPWHARPHLIEEHQREKPNHA